MRFNEFYVKMTKSTLLEDKQQYRAIINSVVRAGIIDQAEGNKVFKDVRSVLKRSDRISWWLRWWRLSKFYDSARQISDEIVSVIKDATQRGDNIEEIGQELVKPFTDRLERLYAAFEKATKQDSGLMIDRKFQQSIEDFKKHFGNLDQLQQKWLLGQSPEVDAIKWNNYIQAAEKSITSEPKMLYHDLLDADRERRNQLRGRLNQLRKRLVERQPGDRVILDYGDYAWVKLDREYCRAEAGAMSHCGNQDYKPGDRIFSLRSKVSDHVSLIDSAISIGGLDDAGDYVAGPYKWTIDNLEKFRNTELEQPHLTFILDKDGVFGEMKGEANSKPKEKYHPYIVDLILQDFVKGFKRGAYKPERDFKISDLSDELQSKVLEKKPEFLTSAKIIRDRGVSGLNDSVFYERLKAELDMYEIPYSGIDSVQHWVILAEEPSIDRLLARFGIESILGDKISMMINHSEADDQNEQFYILAQGVFDHLIPPARAALITHIKNNHPELALRPLESNVIDFIDDVDVDIKQAFYRAVEHGRRPGSNNETISIYREWMEENNIRYDPKYKIFYVEVPSQDVSFLIEWLTTRESDSEESMEEQFNDEIAERYLMNSHLDDLYDEEKKEFDVFEAADYLTDALGDLGIWEG